MRDSKNQIIAALDVGSTKVVVAIARVHQGQTEIIGVGKSENTGIRQGQIVNMAETQQAIADAREEAELMAGVKLTQVYLSVGAQGAQILSTTGMVAVVGEDVVEADVKRVLEMAKALHIPVESRILHALPRTYTLDGQAEIDSPLGMKGIRLEVDAQLIVASEKSLDTLVSCVQKCGLKIKQIVLSQLASTLANIDADEKEMGVAVVEIGGGTCEIVVYRQGTVTHIGSIPVGGLNFTQDVAVGLKTPINNAEVVKKKYGTALVDMVGEDEMIEVMSLGDKKNRQIPRIELCRILEARAEETLSLIFNQLSDWDVLKDLSAGIVLTGGGSLLQGIVELAEFTFNVPVRRGVPKNVVGLRETYNSPIFSTAIGTLLLGAEIMGLSWTPAKVKETTTSNIKTNLKTWEQIKNFMSKALSI